MIVSKDKIETETVTIKLTVEEAQLLATILDVATFPRGEYEGCLEFADNLYTTLNSQGISSAY